MNNVNEHVGTIHAKPRMNIDRIVFAFAGLVILASLALSQLHSVYWLWLTAFVGLNLFQAAFTGFCPLAKMLGAMGRKPGAAFE
jgi:hypothetical protein